MIYIMLSYGAPRLSDMVLYPAQCAPGRPSKLFFCPVLLSVLSRAHMEQGRAHTTRKQHKNHHTTQPKTTNTTNPTGPCSPVAAVSAHAHPPSISPSSSF